jgi:hypothetical protein
VAKGQQLREEKKGAVIGDKSVSIA